MKDDDRRTRADTPADAIVPLRPDRPALSLKALADKTRHADAVAGARRPARVRRIRGALTEDDRGWLRSRTPSDALADEVLSVALPLAIQRRLLRDEPVVVVDVPAADWVDPIAEAVETMSQDAVLMRRDGSRRDHTPASGNPDVATALADGKPVVGVSQSPAVYLPTALTGGADLSVVVTPPDGAALRRLLAHCGRRPVPRTVADATCAGLSFGEIASAFRQGASGRDVVAALDRMRAQGGARPG